MVKPEHFYTTLDEEQRMTGECDRTRGYDLSVVTWWKLSRLVHSNSLSFLLSSGIRILLFFRYREVTSHMRVVLTFRERSESPSYTCHFTHSFNLKCSLYRSVIFWGSVFGKYLGKPISHMTDFNYQSVKRLKEKGKKGYTLENSTN